MHHVSAETEENLAGLTKHKSTNELQINLVETTSRGLVREMDDKRPLLTLFTNVGPPLSDADVALNHPDEDNPMTSTISGLSEPNSLFDEPTIPTSYESSSLVSPDLPSRSRLALLIAPPIPGLFLSSLRLPEEMADSIMRFCLDTYFQKQGVNQVMLFGRATPSESNSGLPSALTQLLSVLDAMLLPVLPHKTHELLFPRVSSQARQAILNLYLPGEGISPHVDLLGRFGDGIMGVSLGSGCVMEFRRDAPDEFEQNRWDVYLPERSVIILSEDARYKWTHGIGQHPRDYVAMSDAGTNENGGRWIERGVRLSITFRWLLPGADIVGGDQDRP